jgi:S-DNA-T family DNA segregation ATPase FtsK/SpoIIIE
MKPIRIVLAPTRSRPLNIFLGLGLLLAALLVLLALATYQPSDPSLNTAGNLLRPHNWIGLFGAYFSDVVLQSLGLTAFFVPLWLGGLGWTWMRSRPGGSAWLRWIGTILALVFFPAVLGLLPWRLLWQGRPIEGVSGMLMAGLLVRYLNIQGAWLVAGALAATGLVFASAVSFWVIKEGIQNRWRNFVSAHERWRNWREERAERKQERIAEREDQRELEKRPAASPHLVSPQLLPEISPEEDSRQAPLEPRPGFFARLFRRQRIHETDPQDIPAFQRAPLLPEEDDDPSTGSPRRRGIRGGAFPNAGFESGPAR